MRWISLFIVVVLLASIVAADCSDSDGGKDSSIAGIAESDGSSYEDSCVDVDISDSKRLKEYFCDRDSISSVYIECEVMCSDGRCISDDEKKALNECHDSDSGIVENVLGTIEGRVNFESEKGTFTDYCLLGHNDLLMEYYCDEDDFVSVEIVTCDSECSGGICKDDTSDVLDCPGNLLPLVTHCSSKGELSITDSITCPDSSSCCESQKDCAIDGICLSNGESTKIGNTTVFCKKGFLGDCDVDEATCTGICNLHWAGLGEPNFIGEYDREIEDCCGDDSGEFFINGSDGVGACCDEPSDYSTGGVCYKNSTAAKVNVTELRKKLVELYDTPDNETGQTLTAVESNGSKEIVKTNDTGDSINIPFNPPDPVSKGIFKRLLEFILGLFQ